ncbi:MAG TPA: dihydropteroate synthase [Candidatus Marinimicrobia bacterium]|nr:dihydropteroate synthase [Candidatus Neomarinimicrobiota bacterium]
MESLGADPAGIAIMAKKGEFYILKTDPIVAPAANILKQQILSVGGDCATSRDVPTGQAPPTPVILMATRRQYERLIIGLKQQCFGLDKLSAEIEEFLAQFSAPKNFCIGQQEYQTGQKTLIMGILNVTPDSFYDGGQHMEVSSAVEIALQMEADGADLIDLGGESTRPGSDPISAEVEIARLKPVLVQLLTRLKIPISVDTYKSTVAEWALKNGAVLINDISGLNFDSQMADTIANHDAGVVLMHIKGTPKNMQTDPHYTNLIDEILQYLADSVQKARTAGIEDSKIFIDPGIGFGKTAEDNYRIMRYLEEFRSLGFPILIGPSRKAFIGHVLNLPPEERLEGTLAAVTAAVLNGADLVRVHDVKAAVRAVKIADAIKGKR